MRICALRILLTATFSMALVIFCVLLMLAILLQSLLRLPFDTYRVSRREPRGSAAVAYQVCWKRHENGEDRFYHGRRRNRLNTQLN